MQDSSPQLGGQSPLGKLIDHELTYGRDIIRDFAGRIGPMERAIDLGAGLGTDLKIIKEVHPKAQTFAVECYPEYARNLEALGIQVVDINIEKDALPFEEKSLDLIIANQVIEHTKEIFWIFDQISRSLKVGGHAIIGLPNIASLHNRFLFLFGMQPTQMKSYSAHIRGFTPGDFKKFLEIIWPGGYRIKAMRGSQFYPFPRFLAKPLSRLFPGLSFSMFFLIEKREDYQGEFLRFPVEKKLETPYYLGPEEK